MPVDLALAVLQGLRATLLDHRLLKALLVAGAPLRLAIAANIWAGRSLRAIAAELARRLMELVGWLAGRVSERRLRGFERAYFALRRWHVLVGALLAGKLVQWVARRWTEYASGARQRRRELQARMDSASSYKEWAQAAQELEALRGRDARTLFLLETRLYDRRLLQERLQYLRRVRQQGNVDEVMFAVRSDLLRNLGNMTNSLLHEHFPVVPDLIREYIQQVQDDLRFITSSPDAPLDERLAFLRESRHAFGRTALVLSGGGSFGAFHMGIVKALLDANLLPRVVSGSSAGSIVSAIICTRTESEVEEVFDSLSDIGGIEFYSFNTVGQVLRHMLLKGTLQDHTVLQDRLRRILGDLTFAEAYQRSGRILNVMVSAADTREPPRLLNYLTAPNVLIWSAVACSSAFPFLYVPQQLLARDSRGQVVPFSAQTAGEMQRRWRDGSLEEDLPMRGLSEMFNVNYFVVSQCNPYVLPLVTLKRLVPRQVGNLVEGEFKHRCKQLMEILPGGGNAVYRLLKLLNQPWEGDCTMVLPVTTLSTLKSVVNLSREDLLRAVDEGKRAAWAKLSAIQANCAVEATIDECLRQLTAVANAARRRAARRARAAAVANGSEGGGGMRRGIPSWVHMPSLGLPLSESKEALLNGGETPRRSGSRVSFHIESPRASVSLDQLEAAEMQLFQPALAPRSPRAHALRLSEERSDILTDTAVPEEAEREAAEAAAEAAAADGTHVAAAAAAPAAAASQPVTPEDSGAFEEEEEAAAAAPLEHLESGRALWRDFFSVAPITTTAGAVTSTSLDFIAP